MTERIRDLKVLARMLYDRGRDGRRAVLLPETACFIGASLKVAESRPTRDEIVAIICDQRCYNGRCHPCMNKANLIHNAFKEDSASFRSAKSYQSYLAKFPKDWMRRG